MPTKPSEKPQWAANPDGTDNDVVDPTSGQNNVIEPSSAKKLSGFLLKEYPTRQSYNWLYRIIFQWIDWLDKTVNQELLTTSGPSFVDLALTGGNLDVQTGDIYTNEIFNQSGNWSVDASGNAIFDGTIDTGQGATELYPMDQAVRTTDSTTFSGLLLTGNLDVQLNGIYAGSIQTQSGNIQLLDNGDASAKTLTLDNASVPNIKSNLILGSTRDIYTTDWADISGSVAVEGWSGTPTISARKKQIGKFVHIEFAVDGTSSTTTAKIQITGVNASTNYTASIPFMCKCQDNTSSFTLGYSYILAGSDDILCNPTASDTGGNGWTASGAKSVIGRIVYPID